jgi:citrate lyase subunit beta/citryl-CoA lyase
MPAHEAAPVWRSLLYVPANNRRFIDKAHARGADAIILDLEDSVPGPERDKARAWLKDSAASVAQKGADVVVRVNRPDAEAARDLDAAVIPGVTALMLPKCDDAAHVRGIADKVAALEAKRGMPPGRLRFVVMVETPKALFRAEEIAAAHPRNVAAVLGGEDFAAAAGMVPDPETLYLPKLLTMLAARAAGVVPLGMIGTVADYQDLDAVCAVIRRSRKFGFEGASCIHPSVVPLLNDEMRPGVDEVARARRIVDEYRAAEERGLGAIAVDGMMVDVPVAIRAEALLARHAAIEAREAKARR